MSGLSNRLFFAKQPKNHGDIDRRRPRQPFPRSIRLRHLFRTIILAIISSFQQLHPYIIQQAVAGEDVGRRICRRKLQECILAAGNYFANRCIARNFNENLEAINPANLHCLVPQTLLGYMGKHLLYIRKEVAPDHPDFVRCVKEDDYPSWYTSFRVEFESACTRFQLLHNGDEIFAGHDINPLYRSIDKGKACRFPHARYDLKNIMQSLWKHATANKADIARSSILM